MTTVLICLAAAFLLAGTAILFLSPSGSSHVTIRGEGSIVTVRSAARSGVTISFDPTGIPGGEPPAALVPAAEPLVQTTWEDEACDEGLVPPEPDYYYDD